MLKHCYLSSCVLYIGAVLLTPLGPHIVLPSQCHVHRLPLTKIPTSISRVAASLDRPSSVEPQGSPVLQRLRVKVGEWQSCTVAAGQLVKRAEHIYNLFKNVVYFSVLPI